MKKIVIFEILLIFSTLLSSCGLKAALNNFRGEVVQVNSDEVFDEVKQKVQSENDIIKGELGKIKRLFITEDKILFKNLGLKDISLAVQCIKKIGDKWTDGDWKKDLHIGMSDVEIVESDGLVTLIKIHKEPDYSYIRVALTQDVNRTNDDNIYFTNLTMRSQDGFLIESGEGDSYIENDYLDITSSDGMITLSTGEEKYTYKDEVRISPRLLYMTIPSIIRGGSDSLIPRYYGLIEICNLTGEMFNVINELPIESYIKAVVPSEVGANSNEEALKVQSILSRTFAYREYLSNRYSAKGFWVQDSISSQVYNNKAYNEKVEKAVEDTKGLVVKNHLGDLQFVYFYSTSSGFSSTPTQVWYRGGDLTEDASMPCQSFLYDESGREKIDLYNLDEQRLSSIYKDLKLKSPDGISPFFRWKVSFDKDELRNTIESNLAYLHDNNPDLVLVKDSDGKWIQSEDTILSIGDIMDVSVEKRGTGGNIIELSIKGDEDEVLIIGEYYIRSILRPSKTYTKGNDVMLYMATSGADDYMSNLARLNYNILPSTFFTFDLIKEGDLVNNITIYGGGNGHGAGISQNGMRALADAGEKYDEIINTYMSNVKIENIE